MPAIFSPKFEVRDCRIGKGLIATEPIAAGELISDFTDGTGKYLTWWGVSRNEDKCTHFVIQVSDFFYYAKVNGPEKGDPINHSCDPNCGFKGLLRIVAMRDIASGEEITIDYAMTEADFWYRLECDCQSKNCRGVMKGTDWRNKDLQKKYEGFFSDFIAQKIKRHPLHQFGVDVVTFCYRKIHRQLWRIYLYFNKQNQISGTKI